MDTSSIDRNDDTHMLWLERIHAILSLISSIIVLVSGSYVYMKTKDDVGELSRKLLVFNALMGGISSSACVIINYNVDKGPTKDFVLIGSGLININPVLVDAWMLIMFITVQVQIKA